MFDTKTKGHIYIWISGNFDVQVPCGLHCPIRIKNFRLAVTVVTAKVHKPEI